MSKTLVHEGKVYEIGKLYEFSDCPSRKFLRRLESVVNGSYPYGDDEACHWMCIKEIGASELGKIKDVPVELIDRAVYMFDFKERSNLLGTHGIHNNCFYNLDQYYPAGECTNIRKMVVEE